MKKITPSLLKAKKIEAERIEKIKKAFLNNGFKYIKMELEAELDINDDYKEYYNSYDEEENNSYELSESFWVDFERGFKENLPLTIQNNLKFLKCYNDGSVNTEVTLTFSVDYLQFVPEILKAFNKTCEELGEGVNTENAGLHITLLEGYKYPRPRGVFLNTLKLNNFKREASKLLYGLVFLGTPDFKTRGFRFRDLRISSEDKYSAIYTHNDTCLEFRLFDTCYSEPSYIINYFELIQKTLKFYTDKQNKKAPFKTMETLFKQCFAISKHTTSQKLSMDNLFNTLEARQRLTSELINFVEADKKELLASISKDKELLSNNLMFSNLKNLILQ